MTVDQCDISCIAWQRTVGELDVGCAHQLTEHAWRIVSLQTSGRVAKRDEAVSFALLDRISPRTVTVSWSDPQCCKYGEQVWRLATAKSAGICMLTGQIIAKGQAIYRLAKTSRAPTNANAMMLAAALEKRLPSETTAPGSVD
jgi:hypothetical protein